MEKGKLNWVFCDGYLPPKGDNPEFEGHDALMMTNLNDEKANIELTFIFEDKDPISGIKFELGGMRTHCVRLDKLMDADGCPLLGESVQYTVWAKSNVPICACYGRLDVRQANMAYYSVEGYSF